MASPLIVSNNVASQLNANIGPSDTALLLASGQGVRFPSPTVGQYFYATLVHISTGAVEVVKVTGRSIDTLTAVRGQDGTTAISFATGSIVEMRITAGILQELDWRTNANAAGGPLLLDGSGTIPDAQIPASITRDTELAAAIAAIPGLGFTPVQQGTGVSQLSNTIKIGWKSGSLLGLTVDTTDRGTFLMSTMKGAANGVCPLESDGKVSSSYLPGGGGGGGSYLPLTGGSLTGALSSNSAISTTADITASGFVQAGSTFKSSGTTAILGTTGAGSVYLRPNGSGSTTNQAQLDSAGMLYVVNVTATSDMRLKEDITRWTPRGFLFDNLFFYSFTWAESGRRDLSVIAQEVQAVAPEYVHERDDGMLTVDKASLSLELVLALFERVRDLERRLGI